MKRLLIKFIKKVPFLYNIAKSINKKRHLKKLKANQDDETKYICYTLDEIEELCKIREHYKSIKTPNTSLLIIIKNGKYNLQIHELIENNPNINFISLNYLEKYNKRIDIRNCIFLNYKIKENLSLIRKII